MSGPIERRKIVVMQPYFFPYLGYFSLIAESDVFVAIDEVQYIKHGWVHRNRIISLEKDFQYIRMVVSKASQHVKIKEVRMVEDTAWKQTLKQQMMVYRKKAPYYKKVMEVIEKCLEYKERYVAKWNVNTLRIICEYLGINSNIQILSEMNLAYKPVSATDEWPLNITIALNGTDYYNSPGGTGLYDRKKYRENGVELWFLENRLSEYDQKIKPFIRGLSIIDVMMFNSKEETLKLIADTEIIYKNEEQDNFKHLSEISPEFSNVSSQK